MFRPPFAFEFHPRLHEALFEGHDKFTDVRLPLLPPRLELARNILVITGMKVLESEVFKLPPDLCQAEAVGERRINVEGLFRQAQLFLLREVFERPHVVQPIGKFQQHHTDIVHHGEQHLSIALGLGHLVAAENVRNLGRAVDDVGHRIAEFLADVFDLEFGIFGYVMEEGAGHGDIIEGNFFRHNHRHFVGVVEKRIAGSPDVVLVGLQTEFEGLPD